MATAKTDRSFRPGATVRAYTPAAFESRGAAAASVAADSSGAATFSLDPGVYIATDGTRTTSFQVAPLEREPVYRLDDGTLVDEQGNTVAVESESVGSVVFGDAGNAEVGESAPYDVRNAGTMTRASLACTTAPVGSGLVVDVLLNGDVVTTLTVAAGSTGPVIEALSEPVAIDDLITLEATSVGSTTPATNVVAQIDLVAG